MSLYNYSTQFCEAFYNQTYSNSGWIDETKSSTFSYGAIATIAFATLGIGILASKAIITTLSKYKIKRLKESSDAFLNHVQNIKSADATLVASSLEMINKLLEATRDEELRATYLSVLTSELPHLLYIFENNPDLLAQTRAVQILKNYFFFTQHIMPVMDVLESLIPVFSQRIMTLKDRVHGLAEDENLCSQLNGIIDCLLFISYKMDPPYSVMINSGCLTAMNALFKEKGKVISNKIVTSIVIFYGSWVPKKLLLDAKILPDVIGILFNLSLEKDDFIRSEARVTLLRLGLNNEYKNEIIAFPALLSYIRPLLSPDSDEETFTFVLELITLLDWNNPHYDDARKKILSSLAKIIKSDRDGDKIKSAMACQTFTSILSKLSKSELDIRLINFINEDLNVFPALTALLESFKQNGIFVELDSTYIRFIIELIYEITKRSTYRHKIKFLGNKYIFNDLCQAFAMNICNYDFKSFSGTKEVDQGKHELEGSVLIPLTLLSFFNHSDIDNVNAISNNVNKKNNTLNEKLCELWIYINAFCYVKHFKSLMVQYTSAIILRAILTQNETINRSVLKNSHSFLELLDRDLTKAFSGITSIDGNNTIKYVANLNSLSFAALADLGPELQASKNPFLVQRFIDSELLHTLLNNFEFCLKRKLDGGLAETLNTLITLYKKCTPEQQIKVFNVIQEFPMASLIFKTIFHSFQVSDAVKETPHTEPESSTKVEKRKKRKEKAETKKMVVPPTEEERSVRRKQEKGKAEAGPIAAPSKGKGPARQRCALSLDVEDMLIPDTSTTTVEEINHAASTDDITKGNKKIIKYLLRVIRWTNATEEAVRGFKDCKNGSSTPICQYTNYTKEQIEEQIRQHKVFGILENLYRDDLEGKYFFMGERGPSFLAQIITKGPDGVKHQVGFVNFGIDEDEEGNVCDVYHAKFDPLDPEKIPTLIVNDGDEIYEEEIAIPFYLDKTGIEDGSWTPVGLYSTDKMDNGCIQFNYSENHMLRIFPLGSCDNRTPFYSEDI